MTDSSLHSERRLRPTLRGAGLVAAGVALIVAAYPLGRRELAVAGCFALLLGVGGFVLARIRRPRLEVIRLFSPPVVAAGSVARVTVRIRNLGQVTTPSLAVNDAIPWREAQEPHVLEPIGLGSAEARTRVVTYDVHPPRRGLYAVGPLVVEYGDPFGATRAHVAVGTSDRLTVVPAVVDLPERGPALIEGDGSAQLVQRKVAGSDDDLTTREYRSGDALRRVHWRASARHGELMVRQEEPRSHPDARIIVDTRLAGYPGAVLDSDTWPRTHHSEEFEWAVRMLASLAVHLDESGFRLEIVESGPAQVEQIGERWEGSSRIEGFLTSLAAVRLIDRPYDLPVVSAGAAGPTFAILADAEPEVVEWVLRQRRQGQAGAAFLLGTSMEARERLADLGWVCVDVEPDDDIADVWRFSATEAGYARGAH